MCGDHEEDTRLTFAQQTVAGSFAGLMEHLAMFPVDTVKTHVQTHRGDIVSSYKNIFEMVKNSGVSRLWRGVQSVFAGCVPAHAAYFSIFELSKRQLGVDGNSHKPLESMAVGTMSVMAHDSILTPLDLCKQRLQLGYYRGLFDAISSVIRTEGFRALYVSYPTTLAMNIPFHSIMVASNESLKILLNANENESIMGFFVCGAASGAIASACTTPLDVIKTRLQTQNLNFKSAQCCSPSTLSSSSSSSVTSSLGHAVTNIFSPKMQTAGIHTMASSSMLYRNQTKGFFDTMQVIAAEQGVRGFFRGIVPRVLFHAPSAAISWTSYEFIKSFFLEEDHHK